jgi:hypothetical protein
MIRWLVLSLLVLKLGPGAVQIVENHALSVVAIVGALVIIGFAWWWMRKKTRLQTPRRLEHAHHYLAAAISAAHWPIDSPTC